MTRRMFEIAVSAVAVVSIALSVNVWLRSREAQHQLASAFSVEQKLIAQSDLSKRQQDQELKSLLKEIEKVKQRTQTPAQVIKQLPKYLALPKPITIPSAREPGSREVQSASNRDTSKTSGRIRLVAPDSHVSQSKRSIVVVPAPSLQDRGGLDADLPLQDLKPLFDYVQDRRICDAEIKASRKAMADDSVKMAALTRERDLAIRTARGGSFWHRARQGLVLFAFGAIAGYTARR